MATKTLSVVISGDAAGAQRAFQQTTASADALESKMASVGKKMADTGKALTLGITLPVVGLAAVGFKELEESGKVAAQTEAVIRSTGGAANVTAKQVDQLGQSLLNKSGIDDETIKSGENLLLTFRNVRNEAGKGNDIFTQATKASLDLSVAFGKDMTQSAILVGKALNDPIKGLTALQRVGVTFTAQQKEQIQSLVESGDVMGAQKVILAELTSEVGGSAAAYGDTMAGQVSKAKEELKNAAAAMVTVAAPAVKFLGDRAMELAGFLNGLSPAGKTAVAAIAGIAAVVGPSLVVIGKLIQAFSEGGALRAGIQAIGDGFVALERAAVNAVIALQQMDKAQLLTNLGFAGAIVGVGALIVALESSAGPYERISEAATAWGRSQVTAAKSSGDEYKSLLTTQRALSAHITDLKSQQAELTELQKTSGGATAQYNDAMTQNAEALLQAQKRHEALAPEIQRLRGEMEAAKATEAARKSGLDAVANSTQTLATTTDAGRQAIADFNNQMLAAAGGPLAYQQAVQNQTAAQDALNKAIEEHGPLSAEAAQAQIALQQAQLGVSQAATQQDQAQAALTQSLIKGNTTYDDQLKLLYAQLLAHPENAAGIDLEKEALDRAAYAALLAKQQSGTITLDADTSGAMTKLSLLGTALDNLSNAPHNVTVDVAGVEQVTNFISDQNVKYNIVLVR